MSSKQTALPVKVITSLAVLASLGALIVAKIPSYDLTQILGWTGVDGRRLKLGVVAYAIFAITAVVLWVARKAFRLPVAWFLYSLLFNGLIICVKFISSPNSYSHLEPGKLIATAAGVGLLYLAALWIIYLFFAGKILTSLQATIKTSQEVKLLFAAGLFVFINFVRIIIFTFTPLAKTTAATYLTSVFQGGGLLLSIVLFLIIVGAVETFDRSKHDSNALRGNVILAATLIIIYHVLWVIFVNGLTINGACNC